MIGTKKKIYSRKLSEKETYERGIAFRLRIVDSCGGIKRQARKNKMTEDEFVDRIFELFKNGRTPQIHSEFQIYVKVCLNATTSPYRESLTVKIDRLNVVREIIQDFKHNPSKEFDRL